MMFEVYLVRRGVISAIQLVDAIEEQHRRRKPLGQVAIESRNLSVRQVLQVLNHQAIDNRPFGAVSVGLGFMTEEQLAVLLKTQADADAKLSTILVEKGHVTLGEIDREFRRFREVVAAEYSETPVAEPPVGEKKFAPADLGFSPSELLDAIHG